MTTPQQDEIIWRQDFARRMNVTSESVRRWIRDKKLPAPDVHLSLRTMGWKMSTLAAAGIRLPLSLVPPGAQRNPLGSSPPGACESGT